MEKGLFYLTTIPGLETVAHLELCDKWARASAFFSLPEKPIIKPNKGGFEFEAPLSFGLTLNQYLRVPNRILLREKQFLADHESKLIDGVASIDWNQYFDKGQTFDFQLDSKASKISLKRQVQRVLEKALNPLGVGYKKGSTRIFVRIQDDLCNISLDTTGELAFKRGVDSRGSIASLRNSTAAGLLRLLFQDMEQPFCLIDPMCGAGTFLVEALQINQKLKRKFAYQKFPMVKMMMEDSPEQFNLTPGHYPTPKKVFGYDIHEKAVELSRRNGSHFSKEKYQVEQQDLFKVPGPLSGHNELQRDDNSESHALPTENESSATSHLSDSLCPERGPGTFGRRVVVLNPPWGKRLPASSQDVLTAVIEKFDPHRIGFLMPAKWKVNTLPMKKTHDISIMNSGVENRFLVFSK